MRNTVAAALILAAATATATAASADLDAELGRALFERDWVPAPASTDAADGLGPLFSARGCAGCHAGPALAARFTDAPEGRIAGRGFVIRFGDAEGRPDPTYGHLLQGQAIEGMLPEGRVVLLTSAEEDRSYRYLLHLERGPLAAKTRQSPRLAPPVIGRAALEKIDAEAVLSLVDPEDRNGDGISGRARLVATDGMPALGRYGWKAAATGLDEQIADAFARDLGLSSRQRPLPHGDCTEAESDCLAAPTGESARFEGHELSQEMIALVAAYVKSLPERQPAAGHAAGEALFSAAGCPACHVPSLPAREGGMVIAHTDLLLHDMGPGLDDGVGEPGVVSAEWRTAPLIAMAPGGGRRYLHDGRAATLDVAIRAHGGEAAGARSNFLALSEDERMALVAYVEGL